MTPSESDKMPDDARLLQIMALFDKMEVTKEYVEREKITWQAHKIVTELNDETKALISQRDELLAALKDIKAEFERLSGSAETVRDMVYLDGVIAVIDSRSEAAIKRAEGV